MDVNVNPNPNRRSNLLIRTDLFKTEVRKFARSASISYDHDTSGSEVSPCAEQGIRLLPSSAPIIGSFDFLESHLLSEDDLASCNTDPFDDDLEDGRLLIDDCQELNKSQLNLECYDCCLSFASEADLNHHLKDSHQVRVKIESPRPSSPWRSLSADQSSNQKSFLIYRQSSQIISSPVHQDSSRPSYECEHPGCGRRYSSNSSLVKHRKTHLLSSSSLEVTQASTGAQSPTDLKRNSSERKFQCTQCPKKFPTSKDLKRHDVVHTGNREFQCSFCSHRFGRKDHRMRHEKKTHASEISPVAQLTALPGTTVHPIVSPSPKTFSPKTSTPKASVKIHQQSVPNSSPQHQKISPRKLNLSPSSQQDYLVVQRQPQWSRRSATPPLPQFQCFKTDHQMGTIKEEMQTPIHDLKQEPVDTAIDLQREYSNSCLADTSQLDEMTLAIDDDEEAQGNSDSNNSTVSKSTSLSVDIDCGGVQGLDWLMAEYMTCDEIPKSSANDFYHTPKCEDLVALGDLITKTKNPVLPSVYVDNSNTTVMLSTDAQKQRAPKLLDEDDFMADVDMFLRDKDIFANI